jgi:predicted dehydrogenase
MMAEIIRAALLGAGHAHAVGKMKMLKALDEYELVGVCEPDQTTRDRLLEQKALQDIRLLTEEELLADLSIEVVAVEGKVQQNLALARRALEAGKHVHLDKPAGTDLSAFRALLDDATKGNLLVQMGYQFRYNSAIDFALKAVKGNWLGDIFFVHGSIGSRISGDARRENSFHPGGMMLELGCHLIDVLVAILGRPPEVTSVLRHDSGFDDELADNTLAVFHYPHAVAVVESAAMESEGFQRRRLEICGTEGTIIAEPIEPPAVRLHLIVPREGYSAGWQEISVPNTPRYEGDLRELARCVRAGGGLSFSTDHDFVVQETILRACGQNVEEL